MDTAQWPQGIGVVKPMETGSRPLIERRARPQKDQALNCPRCNSTNTKFCYYNNYSLSQPRYFCKACRRYWTEGGSLRNVPVGGGSRKNKRQSTSNNSSSSELISSKKLISDHHHHHDLNPPSNFPQSASQNPKIHHGQDLNLAYPLTDHDHHHHHYSNISKFIEIQPQNPSSSAMGSDQGIITTSTFMHMPVSDSNTMYSTSTTSGFHVNPLHVHFKPSLNFSLEGFESGSYGGHHLQSVQEPAGSSSGLLFPVEDLKQVPSNGNTELIEQNRGQGDHSTPGYWMLGGGSW